VPCGATDLCTVLGSCGCVKYFPGSNGPPLPETEICCQGGIGENKPCSSLEKPSDHLLRHRDLECCRGLTCTDGFCKRTAVIS